MTGGSDTRVLWGLFVDAADRSVCIRLSLALLCATAAGVLAVVGPLVLKFIIDVLAHRDSADLNAQLVFLAMLYLAALALGRLLEQAQAYAFGTGEQRLQQRANARLFDHLLRLPMAYLIERQGGALLQTTTLGLQGARLIVTHALFSVLPALVQAFCIVFVVAGLFDASIWLAVMLAMGLYALVFAWSVRRLGGATEAVMSSQVDAGGLFADTLLNLEPVKAFVAEANVSRRYEGLLADAEMRWRRFHARRFEGGGAAALVFTLTIALVLGLAVRSWAAGVISVGDFVLLNTYLLQVVRPIELAGFAWRDIAQGLSYLERWREVLNAAREEDVVTAKPVGSRMCASAIRFDRVSFAYGAGEPVLCDVSFDIAEGQTLAIVGPSGAGKSSLLRLLLRYYEPTAGEILLNGQPLQGLALGALRKRIAIVSQDTILFNDSLRNNILFARGDASEAQLQRALEKARLSELVARLPQGLDTMVGERGLKLSGGEKQRVAIARACLKDAPIIVLDEATSALDTLTERAIRTDMLEAVQGRTALIVTHRLGLASGADEIVVLERGRVVESGAHGPLLARGGLYARLWVQEVTPSALA